MARRKKFRRKTFRKKHKSRRGNKTRHFRGGIPGIPVIDTAMKGAVTLAKQTPQYTVGNYAANTKLGEALLDKAKQVVP